MRRPSGEQYELAHGDHHAVATEVGAGLRSYTVAGRDVVDGYGADEMASAGRGQVLVPWPNRISGGRYDWHGRALHLPLTDETRGIIGEARLGKVKPGAVLVNTSRGPLVDLSALGDALRAGRLAAAALDVFESEPVDPARIADIPNLIATPHMAYYSEEALEESQRKAATQVIKVLTGQEPDYQVN